MDGTPVNARDGLSLGEAAVNGVAKLARASGHRIDVPTDPLVEAASQDAGAPTKPAAVPGPHAASSGGPPWVWLGVGAAALLALAGVVVLRRRRGAAAGVRKVR